MYRRKGLTSVRMVEQNSVKARLYVTECFQNALQAAEKLSYQLVAFLTDDKVFPDSWKVFDLELNCPTLVLTQVNEFHMGLLNHWIDISLNNENLCKNKLVQKSLEYIHEHLYDSELSLEQVAANVYVSKYHFSRCFQKHVGLGFKEYVMQKRVDRAKVLLQGGNSVTNTCFMVGYNDLTHFSKVFKRLTGTPPSQYRRAVQNRYYGRRGDEFIEFMEEIGS